jgi:hypothetical protein
MNRREFNGGLRVCKMGDLEDALNFILRGRLRRFASASTPGRGKDVEPPRLLMENDFFGDIYPFEADKRFQGPVEAVGRVQILRLARNELSRLCRKHPRMELAVIDLYNARKLGEDREFLRMVRRTDRRRLPIRMKVKIFPAAADARPLSGTGYSRDFSVGGACIVLEKKFADRQGLPEHVKHARIEVALPREAMTLNVTGAVVWHRHVNFRGVKTMALGVQFDQMSPQLSGVLVAFADILSNNSPRHTGHRPQSGAG